MEEMMTEIKHILVIPTNRDATAAISSASLEVQEARSLGYDIPLVVIETDNGDDVKITPLPSGNTITGMED